MKAKSAKLVSVILIFFVAGLIFGFQLGYNCALKQLNEVPDVLRTQ